MARLIYTDGVLVEEWRDAPDYAVFDGAGVKLRDYTAEERAAADAAASAFQSDANAETLRQKAAAALDSNATFLANTSPTNAQVSAQVKALTRQVNALIRLQIRSLSDISGT